MIDYGYITSLPELTPTSPPGAAYKVTHDWGNENFDPAGQKYTLYVMKSGVLRLKSYATLGDNSEIFILGTVQLARTVTIGNGSRIVFGQNGVMDLRGSKAILQAKQCYLEAPVKQIFKEGIEVQGIWEIPTAYPQWFTSELPALDSPGPSESESLDSTLHDWSIEINKAITMKGTGEVFLPKGTYNVSNPIIMKPGLQLRGTCGVNWDNNSESGTGSTIIRANVPGSVENPYDDFIVYVNVTRNADGKYTAPTADLFQSGTLIENIHFKAANFSHPRCIVAGCPCHFNNLGFRNFRQAVKYIDVYCDGRRITNCNAGDGFTKKVATTADDDYIFDLFSNGDACIFEGTHVISHVYKALKIGNSCGSVIQGCILNAPVHLRFCKGTIFAANHMESSAAFNLNADTHLLISNSDVTVQGNYFEKSKEPSIIIEDGQYGDTSVVNLIGNQFVYITGKGNSNEGSNLSLLQNRINNLNEYDVRIDAWSVVTLDGNFRYAASSNSGVTSSFPFGVMLQKTITEIRKEILNGAEKDVMYKFPGDSLSDFNDKSYCLSQFCLITGEKVATDPVNLNESGDYLSSVQPVSHIKWLIGTSGTKLTYSYEYCIYPGGIKPATETFKKISNAATPAAALGDSGMMMNVNFRNSGGRALVKLRRSVVGQSTSHTVLIPICGARNLYDNGIAIAGFKWMIEKK